MDLPSRCNYQKLFQVLRIDLPDSLPGTTKCPVCNTIHSLHVHNTNSTGTAYFCNNCGFIGDSIQLFKEANKYYDLDTACTDMMSIPGLLAGNLVDVRSNVVNYAKYQGPAKELWSSTLQTGWSRLTGDLGVCSNILWDLGLLDPSNGASNLLPHFCVLTPNELEDVFNIDGKFFRRVKNRNKKLLCLPLYTDLATINGFVIFKSATDLMEVCTRDTQSSLGLGFYLSFNKSSKFTYVFDDISLAAQIHAKYRADYTSQYMLYKPIGASDSSVTKLSIGKPIIAYSDFVNCMKASSNVEDSLVFTVDEGLSYTIESGLSSDISKLLQSNSYNFTKAFLKFASEYSDIHVLELLSSLTLSRDQIQRIINEAPVSEKMRLEDMLVETKEDRQISVFDKLVTIKGDCWYEGTSLISDCTFEISSVTHDKLLGSIAFGYVNYQGNSYNFSSNLKEITKDPITWLQTLLIKEGAGLPQINRKYKNLLYNIAITQQPPKAVTIDKTLGWSKAGFSYAKFDITDKGFVPAQPGQYINSNISNVNIPDDLTFTEIDDLLSDTIATRQFWTAMSYMLYSASASKYSLPKYNLCFVSKNYADMSMFLDNIKHSIGGPDFNFSSSKKGGVDRQILLADESSLPCVIDYHANYRMPGFCSWLSRCNVPVITAAPNIDFYNFRSDNEWVYIKVDELVSDNRYLNLFRYFWLKLKDYVVSGVVPKYDNPNIRVSLQNITYECLSELAKYREVKVPQELCPAFESNWCVKPRNMSDLERFVSTCMCWVEQGAVELKTYLDSDIPNKEDRECVVYTGGQYLFPRDYLLPMFVREGFVPPQAAVIEKDLKSCSNEDYSFKLHTQHWWRVPFAEVAYHREL